MSNNETQPDLERYHKLKHLSSITFFSWGSQIFLQMCLGLCTDEKRGLTSATKDATPSKRQLDLETPLCSDDTKWPPYTTTHGGMSESWSEWFTFVATYAGSCSVYGYHSCSWDIDRGQCVRAFISVDSVLTHSQECGACVVLQKSGRCTVVE